MSLRTVLPLILVLSGCRFSHSPEAQTGPAFEEVAERANLIFHHRNGARGEFHLPEIMGSGVALLDYDGDGDLDVYLVQGEPGAGGNRMFRNEIIPSGTLRFTDVSAATGTQSSAWGMGAVVADYDSDGDPDLLVTNLGRNVLYRNDGGRFSDVTRHAGVASEGWHTSAAFLDYDRDGDLDLFICRYVDFSPTNAKTCRNSMGQADYCTPRAYRPIIDRLFQNEGGGRFRDVSADAGLGGAVGPGLGVTTGDFNEDTWPDLYVANDGEANHLWVNRRNGSFEDVALEAGVAFSDDGMPQAGMGIAVADYDNDGDEDIAVTNLTREGATLYRNEGALSFSDLSARIRLRRSTFSGTGFGVGWLDYDGDGCLDLFVANGAVTIINSQRGQPRPFRQHSQFLRGNCYDFSDDPVSAFEGVARGAAFGDIDRDGDVDIVVTENGGPVRLLLNRGRPALWLRVHAPPGSTVLASTPKGQRLRRIRSDGSYLSSSEPAAHFTGEEIVTIGVKWPDGSQEQWGGIQMNRAFTPKKGTGVPVP